MNILGIETSCDDTSAAVYDGHCLKSNIVSTQIVHRHFGGVVPELASRSHIQIIVPVIQEALNQAGLAFSDLEGIAVTQGPGLAGSLLVGLSVAKGLSLSLGIPVIGVNHLEGHIWSNMLDNPDLAPPFLVLIVSGGHTQLVRVDDWGKYRILGRTRDDAAGEAFDKVGKLLKVGYPGGPAIEKLALEGRPDAFEFPRAFLDKESLDFSFSGLKTAVLNQLRAHDEGWMLSNRKDIAASFQEAVVDVLAEKALYAARQEGDRIVCIAGGVSVNQRFRKRLSDAVVPEKIRVLWPSPSLCTDNGGMIAAAGHFYLASGKSSSLSISPMPSLNFA
ncbi:MAG TPA: tRNA (adenosine(37)-N6)-threonylcarbamoyltransferase complex transferase subunit TsaD [bacterium]|nr:tRNA (adenosine(37)-N6)-threonylcarbamoyltransferase complex transferase subunit TsaD [bacterium]